MKILKKLFIANILIGTLLSASSIYKGTSIGKYNKPGLSVNITYEVEDAEVGESSDVNITLTTPINTGTMSVKMKKDNSLIYNKETNDNIELQLNKNTNEYPINLQVSANSDGLYYIRLIVSIDGLGSRAFVVPVLVGEGKEKNSSYVQRKSAFGENISISVSKSKKCSK